MEITCPNCLTKYNLDENRLSPEGSPVRCTRCQHQFTAHRPALQPAPEAPLASAPETPPPEAPEPAPEGPPEAPPEPSPEEPLPAPPEPAPEGPPEAPPEAAPEGPAEDLPEGLLEGLLEDLPGGPSEPAQVPPEAGPEAPPEGPSETPSEAPPEAPPEAPSEGPPEAPPQPALSELPFPTEPEEAETPPPESAEPLPGQEQETEPVIPVEEPPQVPVTPALGAKRRGGLGGFLVWSLVWLILLAGAVYGALIFIHQTELFPRYIRPVRNYPAVQRTISLIQRVPYLRYPFVDQGLETAVQRLMDSQVKAVPWFRRSLQPGPAKKAPPVIRAKSDLTIVIAQGRFVTEARAGRLFVVEGKIKNIGQSPVSYIRLRGTLYTRDQRQQNVPFGKPVLAYAGVVFTADQFKRLPLKAIHERLNDRLGDNRSNYLLQPGHDIGFMIVFDKLPLKKRLSEYVVQIYSSVAGTPPAAGPPGPAR